MLAHTDEGRGPALVFLHGITGRGEQWGPITERLVDAHRCVRVDLPGHGDSPPGDYDLFAVVAEIQGVIDHLELEDPVLVGHSLGGILATVHGVVHEPAGIVNVDQRLATGDLAEQVRANADRLKGSGFEAFMEELLEGLGLDAVPAPVRAFIEETTNPQQKVVLGYWAPLLEADPAETASAIESALPAVTSRYLALFGAPLSPEDERLLGLLPDAAVEVWDGSGHFLHLAEQDRFVDRLRSFVAEVHEGTS